MPERQNKMSAAAAAAHVLKRASEPMTAGELVAAMKRRKLWTSPGGATPERTVSSAILREIKAKGDAARFRQVERGLFTHASK